MRPISKTSTTSTTTTTTKLAPMATPTKIGNTNNYSSPWHTPIPYLFGGLAAVFGLMFFALLVLACSYYCKLFAQQQQNGDNNNNNVGELEKECDETRRNETFKAYEEKVLVIMAGNEKPTFLATPVFPNYGKQLICQDCGSKIEAFDEVSDNVSEKDHIINKDNRVDNVVVHVPAAATTTLPQENQEHEQEENQ
ncbi:hypothetical protein HN51_017324 [Arachis hypogaea]|uniref:Protein GLUTAMINE DUMPER n=1 Tax=Arachis hypogaea TaxID=3818 RepID=A0A445CWZ2_ARAHY|nr:protein GLUTAMINE DUMPER 1 [Arachis ipaensis]XP_025659929.1 protein GLUTAMINE DUMPER 1 [Arachis hypogaea]QHN88837.1 Protein GLUTAMINE DUMPER [Arachis hypogaea]RYR55394.1 hypothetical protein Ahy_A06g030621 [Arachis hypogaea]